MVFSNFDHHYYTLTMTKYLLSIVLLFATMHVRSQQLLLLDRMNDNKIVNDSTIIISSSDPNIIDLTAYLTMKNNTEHVLSLNLRKTVHFMADSTIDYFCFGVQCWPGTDTTNFPDTIQPGAEDYTFASHVVHFRRFDMPPLALGKSSITYTIYDDTSFPEPIEASVTVVYEHYSTLGLVQNNYQQALVYPNPATDKITIVGGETISGEVPVSIYNSSGRLVQSSVVWMEQGKLSVGVEALEAGSYYGRIESHVKKPIAFRFVK